MLLLLCPWMAAASPVKLIIDTDFDSDVDDVADLPDLAEGRDGAEVAAMYDGLILAAERKRLEERR